VWAFASGFYDESSTFICQFLRIFPFQYEKRAGAGAPAQGLSRGQPMQINGADTNESFKLTHSTGRDAEADLLDTQIRGVQVLEAIEQSDEVAWPARQSSPLGR
jgi:hypothetical protein